MSQSGFVHLEKCDIVRESDSGAAFLIQWQGKNYWIPKSQIADADDYASLPWFGVTLSITEWIAKEKGIEGDD